MVSILILFTKVFNKFCRFYRIHIAKTQLSFSNFSRSYPEIGDANLKDVFEFSLNSEPLLAQLGKFAQFAQLGKSAQFAQLVKFVQATD